MSIAARLYVNLLLAPYPTLDNELLRCSHEQIARWGERDGKGGRQLRVIRRCCEKMAVARCVFDLNRGNFSAITKFIGTALARPTRPTYGQHGAVRHSAPFFLLRSCACFCPVRGRIEKVRKKQPLRRRCTH